MFESGRVDWLVRYGYDWEDTVILAFTHNFENIYRENLVQTKKTSLTNFTKCSVWV